MTDKHKTNGNSHFPRGKVRRAVLPLLALMLAGIFTGCDKHGKEIEQSSEQLTLARTMLLRPETRDSAISLLNTVIGRYNETSDSAIAHVTALALFERWKVNFFYNGSNVQAIKDIRLLDDIMRRHNIRDARFRFARTFINSRFHDPGKDEYERETKEMISCVQLADSTRQEELFHIMYNRLSRKALTYCHDSILSAITTHILDNHKCEQPILTEISRHNLETWRIAWAAEEEDELIPMYRHMDSALKLTANTPENALNHYFQILDRAAMKVLFMAPPEDLKGCCDSIMEDTYRYGMRNMRTEPLLIYSICYKHAHDDKMLKQTQEWLAALGDSTLQYAVTAADFENDLKESTAMIMSRTDDMNRSNTARSGWLVLLGVLILGSGYYTWRYYRINRRLGERNKEMFLQLRDAMRNRSEWLRTAGPSEEEQPVARQGISDEMMRKMAERIEKEILADPIVLTSEFDLDAAVSMLDSNRQYVSNTINEIFGCNFSTLVNRVRIRVAMERMADPAYDRYSIDAMAEGVGFNSRAVFTTWFRRIAGMTPAQYRKAAKISDTIEDSRVSEAGECA